MTCSLQQLLLCTTHAFWASQPQEKRHLLASACAWGQQHVSAAQAKRCARQQHVHCLAGALSLARWLPCLQVLFYTLDTLPILLCFLSFILYHPGWYLPRSQDLQQDKAQENENGSVETGKPSGSDLA